MRRMARRTPSSIYTPPRAIAVNGVAWRPSKATGPIRIRHRPAAAPEGSRPQRIATTARPQQPAAFSLTYLGTICLTGLIVVTRSAPLLRGRISPGGRTLAATTTRPCPKCGGSLTPTAGDSTRRTCSGCGASFSVRTKPAAVAAIGPGQRLRASRRPLQAGAAARPPADRGAAARRRDQPAPGAGPRPGGGADRRPPRSDHRHRPGRGLLAAAGRPADGRGRGAGGPSGRAARIG